MQKKLLVLALSLILTLGLTITISFADGLDHTGDGPTTYSTASASFAYRRISDTKATASVSVLFTAKADDYEVKIILQKKTSSGWVTASDISGNTIIYKGSNKSGIMTYDTWTVKEGGLYRVKCVSTDKYDIGIRYSKTSYSDPF